MRPNCYACKEQAEYACESCDRVLCDAHAIADESMGVHLCDGCAQELNREWQENHGQAIREGYE